MSNAGKIIYLDESVFNEYNQEDTMLFPLKESEAKMLLAFVPYIQWQTRWKNLTRTQAELEALAGSIADGLMNPQTGDLDMATIQDICDGVKCAITDVMTSAVAGLNSGVSVTVDPDTGEIVVDTGETQDPLAGTTDEFKWGGSIEVYEGLLEYMTDFEDFFGQFPSNEAQAVSFMSQKWQVNANITQAVSDYYAHRSLSNPAPQPIPSDVKGELFCYGATKQTVASYMIDNVANDILLKLSMLDALLQEQYDVWYFFGYQVPRLGFDEAPCYRVPPETVTLDYTELQTNSWDNILFSGKPDGHRWRVSIKCTQEFVNANGDRFDGVYNTPNGGNPAIGTYKLFEAYNSLITLVEGYGGQLPIGGVYVSEWEASSTRDPRGYRWDIPFSSFTQGSLELTLTDLGKV